MTKGEKVFAQIKKATELGFICVVKESDDDQYALVIFNEGVDAVSRTLWNDEEHTKEITSVDFDTAGSLSEDDEELNCWEVVEYVRPNDLLPGEMFKIGDRVMVKTDMVKEWNDDDIKDFFEADDLVVEDVINNEEDCEYRVSSKKKDDFFTIEHQYVYPKLDTDSDDAMEQAMALLKKNGYKITKS